MTDLGSGAVQVATARCEGVGHVENGDVVAVLALESQALYDAVARPCLHDHLVFELSINSDSTAATRQH
eukprot:COSAG05_NODE_19476_length_292_cov_0.751295_1_plen_69_part_00